MQLEGAWRAQQITFDQLSLRARAGPAVLFLSGRGSEEGSRTNFVLREFTLSKGDDVYLKLASNATVSLAADRQVEITPLRLVGNDKEMVLDGFLSWPREGKRPRRPQYQSGIFSRAS